MGTRRAGRHRAATLPLAAAAALLTALTAPASASEAPSAERSAPLLDENDPHGAWAGYSIGDPASGARRVPDGAVAGMDVSGHQGQVDWSRAWKDGARFAYVKATEGTDFRNDQFDQQYHGASEVGMIRGAYHFALPDRSTGARQARTFVDNGGGWTSDGRTLPGALDIEHNPYGDQCYGLTPKEMSAWIADFNDTYRSLTGRLPSIYTTTEWWDQCTGHNGGFTDNPLWIARHGPELGALPSGWRTHTIWQYDTTGVFPGDQNTFNGDHHQLTDFAG